MNFKRLLGMLLSICIIAATLSIPMGVFALGEDIDIDMGESGVEMYAITGLAGKYKTQGRATIINDILMVDYSASGIEFSALCEGDVSLTFSATKFAEVPIWMYHGTADTTIPFTDSETRYNNLIAAGAENVTFTKYEGLNHDIWDDVALDTEMIDWLFEQNLSNR